MFRSIFNNAGHASIYPGEYELLPSQVRELSAELNNNMASRELPVKIVEGNEFYRVNIQAPGFKREDFFISTNGQVLSIAGMRKIPSSPGEERPGYHPIQTEFVKQDIQLPPDADTEFVSAEYGKSTLSIWVFRTPNPVVNKPVYIIVH